MKKSERKDLVTHNHKNSGQEVPRSAFMSFELLFVRVVHKTHHQN